MTLQRARIVKRAFPADAPAEAATLAAPSVQRGRRVAGEILAAQARAGAIVAEAEARAAALAREAAAAAAAEAQAAAEARLAARFLALRAEEERLQEASLERTVELARLLAERLVGEALALEPARIGELAVAALAETRGARSVRIEAAPGDVAALTALLRELGNPATVVASESLGRGSLVVHTDLGRVDARLDVQLERLAAALREALR